MILTDIVILILLYANPNTYVPISAIKQWANMPDDFDAAVAMLINAGVVTRGDTPTGEHGLMLDAASGGNIIMDRARSVGCGPAQLLLIEEMIADAASVPTASNPFRDAAVAQGLDTSDAAYCELAARTGAARRARRTRDTTLLESAARAGQLSRIAGQNLT